MSLEKSSIIEMSQAELYSIKNGGMPEKFKDSGYSVEDLQAKIEEKEVKVLPDKPKKVSLVDINSGTE